MRKDAGQDAGQTVGLPGMLSIVVGSIIGASIFMLPGSLAPLGWNAALGCRKRTLQ